jgi:cytochrome P450
MGGIQIRVERSFSQAFGEVLRFVKDPLSTFTYLKDTWGDVVPLPLPGPKTIQFTHPQHVGEVLRLPVKDETSRSMEDIMGRSLLTGDGPEWRKHRRMLTPAFSQKSLAPFLETILTLTEDWIGSIGDQEHERDMTEEMLKLTLEVILKTVFGGAVEINRAQVAGAMEEYFLQYFLDAASWRRLIPPFITTPGRRKRARAMRELEAVMYASIDQRRRLPPGSDLLNFMLNATDEAGQTLSDRHLRDETLTLILAGHETTAEMVTYALWLLGRHQETQAELRREILNHVGTGRPTRESLAECKLLSAVLEEALRLFPPAFVVGREAREDCEVAGHRVNRGTQLLVPAWVIHRDERWWRAPNDFRPERWLNGETSELPQHAYFPFGGGPRLCIGRHFAMFEGSIILLSLLQRFEFTPAEGYDLKLLPSVTLRPKHGIRLKVRRTASVSGAFRPHAASKIAAASGAAP